MRERVHGVEAARVREYKKENLPRGNDYPTRVSTVARDARTGC
jgi:type IV pilus biogenesis protein CpaD/CtpE